MSILLNVLLVLFIVVALLMMLVILMQRPKSEGLGAAFGGGVTENIFGAQTTNVLTKITAWLAGIFFFLTFTLSVLYAHRSTATSGLRQQLLRGAPAAAAAPVVPLASPGGPAVGPPNTVTNPTPGGEANVNQGNPPSPADQAVGITQPVQGNAAAPSVAPSVAPRP
ncbi:MAG: preprotein translocase subunit SecG [Verrucomicrobiota bacterium]|nr:preprotein translocase subunit SecG [Verrucomicrobiota bacterium]